MDADDNMGPCGNEDDDGGGCGGVSDDADGSNNDEDALMGMVMVMVMRILCLSFHFILLVNSDLQFYFLTAHK